MKRIQLIALLIAAVGIIGCQQQAEARDYCRGSSKFLFRKSYCVDNSDIDVDPNYESHDYGTYLHFILFESEDKNYEIGLWNTYEHQRMEFTTLLGAKIYLNRLFWQKDEE